MCICMLEVCTVFSLKKRFGDKIQEEKVLNWVSGHAFYYSNMCVLVSTGSEL